MDAREWNASMDRIISTMAEMRDLLRNEQRRWASLPPFFFEPPPTSAPTPPPPASIAPPLTTINKSPPSTGSASPPSLPSFEGDSTTVFASVPPPKQTPQTELSAPKTSPRLNLVPIPKPAPTNLIVKRSSPLFLSSGVIIIPFFFCQEESAMDHGLCFIKSFSEPTKVTEWRPPWRPMETRSYATGRTEWRPPWCFIMTNLNGVPLRLILVASLRTRIL